MTCPRCGYENDRTAKFCAECGLRLPSARVADGDERKVVTALFCDIVGFTERSDQADPEDVKALLRPFHIRVKREIERYDGTVDKFIGDGVFAVFGAPIAHEDDPERAVLAALAIQRAIADLAETPEGRGLQARVGIATGEAVVAMGEGPQVGERITGDVVNTASRLQSVAQPGGVVVAANTYRATKDRFVYAAQEPIRVKGKEEPLEIWRPVASRQRLAYDLTHAPPSPMVGRETDLQLLQQLYERMMNEPSVQQVTVTGEPGVGKSRLVRELFAYIDSLKDVIVAWRQGRCLPFGEGISLWALSEIIRGHAGILDSDSPVQAATKLQQVVKAVLEGPEAEWVFARTAPLVGITGSTGDAGHDPTESFAAWRRFFEALAADRPLVLVFEDLAWADETLLDFVEFLTDTPLRVPLLVVVAARPELFERRPHWGGGKRNSTTVSLAPLSEDETARLVSLLLLESDTELPSEAMPELLHRTGGNPLYAEEFVHLVQERGATGTAVDLADIPVPDTLQAIIAARLDELTREQRAVLRAASVVGETFWAGAVAELENIDEATVRSILQEIAHRELVRPVPTSSVGGQAEFAFWHLAVRDVAYGQLPRAARADHHRTFARWIERIAPDRLSDYAEVLAHHYDEALALKLADGAVSELPELERAAGEAHVLAGDRAERFDLARAETHVRKALELLPREDPVRPQLLARLAEAAAEAGRFDESERHYDAAVAGLRAANNVLGLGETLARRSRSLHSRGDRVRAQEASAEAVALLEELPPGPELARAYTRAAGVAFVDNRNEESLALVEKALLLAERLQMVDERVRALGYRGAVRCDEGDAGGLDDLREAARIGEESGLGEETIIALGNLAYDLWHYHGPAASLEASEHGTEFALARGFVTSAMWSRASQLEALYDLVRWDEVLEISEQLIAWDDAASPSQVGVLARVYRAGVLARRGDVEEAGRLSDEMVPAARSLGYTEIAVPALLFGSMVEELRGNLEASVGLAEEAVALTEGHPVYRLQFLPLMVSRLADAWDPARLRTILPEEERRWARLPYLTWVEARASVEQAAGNLDAAVGLFREAAEGWRELGTVLGESWAAMGLAECLVLSGRAEEASPWLRIARDGFERAGACTLLSRVDEVATSAGRPVDDTGRDVTLKQPT